MRELYNQMMEVVYCVIYLQKRVASVIKYCIEELYNQMMEKEGEEDHN